MLLHWIADFVCQTDTMATRKSKSLFWLLLHVLIYTIVMSATAYFVSTAAWITILYIFATHAVTDYFTSKASAHYYEKGQRHNFFMLIGLDQLIHFITLYLWFGSI